MPGEITMLDSFGQAIVRTLHAFSFRSVLEIGSFDGLGSTLVFINALASIESPRLVCLEPNAERHARLSAVAAGHTWVEPLCMSSISSASFTPKNFDRDVWQSPYNALRYPRHHVVLWWNETQAFYEQNAAPGFLESSSDEFDAILVDGDEFSGYDDFRLAKSRCRCLMLDDVFHAYKCNRAHKELLGDDEWRLVWADALVRNGASIWVRK